MAKNRGKKKKQPPSRKPQQTESSLTALSPVFQERFKDDLRWWASCNEKIFSKVFDLIQDILDGDPFKGIGHPEPLKYLEPGTWSRRINEEHRLVYRVHNQKIHFIQARYHY